MRTKIWTAVVFTFIAIMMYSLLRTDIQSGFWRFVAWLVAIVCAYNMIDSWGNVFKYMDERDKKRRKWAKKLWKATFTEEDKQKYRFPKHGKTPCSKETSISETEDKIKESIRRGAT